MLDCNLPKYRIKVAANSVLFFFVCVFVQVFVKRKSNPERNRHSSVSLSLKIYLDQSRKNFHDATGSVLSVRISTDIVWDEKLQVTLYNGIIIYKRLIICILLNRLQQDSIKLQRMLANLMSDYKAAWGKQRGV